MEHLMPARCALVVVDFQNDFCHDEGAFSQAGHDTRGARVALDPIKRLRHLAHQVDVPVILVRVAHSPWTDDPAWRNRFQGLAEQRRPAVPVAAEGTWGAEFYGLDPDPRDLVITKHRYSAFSHTPLPLVLRATGASTLVITGVQTDVCVLSTARDALDHGVLPIVVADAVATTDQAAHQAALDSVRVRMGPVVDSDDVIEAWSRS